MGINVFALNTHKEFFPDRIEGILGLVNITNLYEGEKSIRGIKGKVINYTKGMLNTTGLCKANEDIRNIMRKIIKDNQIDVIYCLWGSGVIPEIRMIQEEKLGIPIIHNILTYPFALTSWGIAWENCFYGRVVRNIQGRIHCSQNMHDYLDRHFNLRKQGKDIVVMERFSRKYFYNKRLPPLSDNDGESHIVFIGRTDFSDRPWWDDIRRHILEITGEEIHFHLSQTSVKMKNNDYTHMFPAFKPQRLIDGSLANFMTQFDACIVLFNIDRKYVRFYNSLPSRFLFALTAGIPIIMPEGYFKSCQEIVQRYEIGFSYKSIGELKTRLCDRKLMEKYRQNALEATPNFTFEKNSHQLHKFIRDVIEVE